MIIVLHVFLALAFVYFSGFGLVGILSMTTGKEKSLLGLRFLIPVTGYCLSQLAFWYGYALIGNAQSGLIASLGLSFVLNLLYLYFAKRLLSDWRVSLSSLLPERKDASLLLILGGIFLLAAWSYLLIGEGHYFHSGNEDFFDGINGGSAYLTNPLDLLHDDFKGPVRLQYSSQAFWRLFLNVGSMDAFLIQSILNLLLTALGVYWLARYVFWGNHKAAIWIAFSSVAANFYFTTYLAGHIGSMMYGSVAPALLGVFLLWSRKQLHFRWLILVGMFFYFLSITYPGPINFLIIPAALLALHERILSPFKFWKKVGNFFGFSAMPGMTITNRKLRWSRIFIVGLLLALVGVFLVQWVWVYFAPYRISALIRTNVSWKIALFKEIWIFFWGVFPSNLVGATSALPLLISNDFINKLGMAVSILLSSMVLWGAFLNRLTNERRFLFLYILFFPIFFVVMRYFWGSPYYTYKFLYVNLFIIVIVLGLWLAQRGLTGNVSKRIAIVFLLVFVGGINLFWDISRGLDILQRPYHQKEKIADFLHKVSVKDLSQAALDIPSEVDNLVFGYLLREQGIVLQPWRAKAAYLVQLRNIRDVSHNALTNDNVIYDNGFLRMIEQPTSNYLYTSSSYAPENLGQINLNWVGNNISELARDLNRSVSDAIGFVRRSGIEDKTFVDIADASIYVIIQRMSQERQVLLQLDPRRSNWFLRLRSVSGISDKEPPGLIYDYVPGEKIIWQSDLFVLAEVPLKDRRVSAITGPDLDRDFSPLIKEIKQNGGEVFLDMPPHERVALYLEQVLKSQGIRISSLSDVSLLCRFTLSPAFENYDYRTVTHPRERVVWQSSSLNLTRRAYELQLVSMPKEGRVQVEPRLKTLIPYRFLFSSLPGDFHIHLSHLRSEARYLRVLLAPGPSIDFSPFNLLVRSDDGKVVKRYKVPSPTTCIDLPLADFQQQSDGSLTLHLEGEDLIGHSLLPIEERFLNYAVLAVELTDQVERYSSHLKSILNQQVSLRYDPLLDKFLKKKQPGEIIAKSAVNKISLGTGWYPYETFNGESFRWVGREAQLILDGLDKGDRALILDLEPGPGCGGAPLTLNVWYKEQLLHKYQVFGKESVNLKLSDNTFASAAGGQVILRLSPETANVTIASDPRILNFRVFNIRLVSEASLTQSKGTVNGTTPYVTGLTDKGTEILKKRGDK